VQSVGESLSEKQKKAEGKLMITEIVEKVKSLKLLVGSIEKQHGKGSIMALGDEPAQKVKVIGSGSIAIDQGLGIGWLRTCRYQ